MSFIKQMEMAELLQRRKELKAALFGITYGNQTYLSQHFSELYDRLKQIDEEIEARRTK